MKQQPNPQPRSNPSSAFAPALHHGAFSSWKQQHGLPHNDSQVQVTQENQRSQQISVNLADVAAKAALQANRSPYSSA